MINNQSKLLFSAFVVIIIGISLIQPISDDIEQVSTYSNIIINESVTLSNVLVSVVNESIVLTDGVTGTLANTNVSVVTEVRNETSNIITTSCNVTDSTGGILCAAEATNASNQTYFDYTYVTGKTGTLLNTDEIFSLDALRNITSDDLIGACNFTIRTGGLVCNNTLSFLAYADYQYDTDQYVSSGAARTLLTLTTLFFALAILAIGVGYAWKSFKEGGVIK